MARFFQLTAHAWLAAMFGNLKSRLGDAADLKKLSSPTSLIGSRQRSRQHTPGTTTPTPSPSTSTASHSRQPSISSLPGIGPSPPLSPTTPKASSRGGGGGGENEKEQELEREISKLRQALETQQDSALDRLNAKEKEWRARLEEERERAGKLAKELQEVTEREKKLVSRLEAVEGNKDGMTSLLKQAQGLEAKVVEMQDNYDQLEGLNAQEGAKVKHMLLNANSELDKVREELKQRAEALSSAESKVGRLPALEERLGALSEEKMELETQVAGLKQRLRVAEGRCRAVEEAKEEEVQHLSSRVATLEQRNSHAGLQETDRIQALIKERELVEHSLDEARQQLNNIKASWSSKITSLEDQIHHLNTKTAEDQTDLLAAEERNTSLTTELQTIREELREVKEGRTEGERRLAEDKVRLEEDVETLKWQLGQKEARVEELLGKLAVEEEKVASCTAILQAKIETIAGLEISVTDLQGKAVEMETSLASAREEIQKLQAEKKRLQESVARERNATESAMRTQGDVEARLQVVMGEKERLSKNLDEYADRVSTLESEASEKERLCAESEGKVAGLENRLREVSEECKSLREQLESSEAGLAHKIEESEVVRSLRENVKALEEELVENKQNLKIQRHRMADMKKTLQRELKLNPDTVDSAPTAPAPTATSSSTPTPPAPGLIPVASMPVLSSSSSAIIDTVSLYHSSNPHQQHQHQQSHHHQHQHQQSQHLNHNHLWKEMGNGPVSVTASAVLTTTPATTTIPAATTISQGTNGNDNNLEVNLTYLKHVIIKYLTSREYEAVHLTRAVATLLHMSEEEEQLLRETLEWKMSWFGSKPNLGKGQDALTIPPSQ